MNKIEEIRNKLVLERFNPPDSLLNGAWLLGWHAAMDLQLPVKFAEYLAKYFMLHDPLGWVKMNTGQWMEADEIYDYWIENIYQPNQGTEDERSVATEDAQ